MRDYLVVGFLLVSFPIGIIRPFYALLVYTWVSFMYPHMLAWGFAQSFPAAKLAVVSLLLGVLINQGLDTSAIVRRETIAMMAFLAAITLSSVFAFYPAAAFAQWMDESKVIVMALMTSMLITTRTRMRSVLLVIGLSLGFYGLKGGIFSIVTGGQNKVFGPGTSIISDNNSIGLALNMALPILWYLAHQERKYLKLVLYGAFFLSIPAIMFTYSRACALTLGVMLVVMCLRKKGLVLIPLFTIAALLATPLIPDKWWNRQRSTLEYGEDESAMSRVNNWRLTWRLAAERPLTGGGFAYQSPEVFQKYFPELWAMYGREYNTHNVWLGILTTHGFTGLIAYVGMIGLSVLSCRRVKRSAQSRPDLNWLREWCDVVQLSFLAFVINGMFVNMEYFDLVFDLVAIAAALTIIGSRELAATESEYAASVPEFAGALS